MSDRRETRESPVLREVAVERKGGVDLEAFHQGKRCAIRIAETFVRVASKDGPCSQFVFGRHPDKSCDLLVPQPIAEPHGYRVPKVFPHERHGFVQDICARQQKVARPLGESNRVGMVPIIPIEKRVPRAGIHEDKGGGHWLLGARVEELVVPDGDLGLHGFADANELCESCPLRFRNLRRFLRQEEDKDVLLFPQIQRLERSQGAALIDCRNHLRHRFLQT